MIAKATAAPVYCPVAGDYTEIECVNGAGIRGHYFSDASGSWQCCHCGGLTRPEKSPTVLRMSDDAEEVEVPAPRATGVRVQPVDGVAFTLPTEGYLLALAPMGSSVVTPDSPGCPPAYTFSLSEITRLNVVHTKGGAS